jgi:hypothetical protein
MNIEEDINRNDFTNILIQENRIAHEEFMEEIRKEGIKIDKINNIYSIISYILLSIIIAIMINLKKIENLIG